MRPRLHPALTRVWRDESTLQIGITPEHAVVLSGLGPAEVAIVNSLDGHVTRDHLRELAATLNVPDAADRLVDELTDAGVIIDAELANTADLDNPDAASVSLVTGRPEGGRRVMRQRRAVHVEVRGCGRVGSSVARLLDTAGVGRVEARDDTTTRPADLIPGGLTTKDIGRPRDLAVKDRLGNRTAGRTRSQPPDFVVLTPTSGEPVVCDDLMRMNTPHLLAQVVETTGIVGPLIVPGRTPCLRCVNLHRTDRDPAWPRILDHLEHRAPAQAAIDSAQAATVAGLAASSVLAHIDGHRAATLGGTIEIVLPGGLPRRRSWMKHPACGCSWVDASEAAQ